jgi:hypothetical protein
MRKAKKPTKQSRAENSARTARGRPFEKGNAHAFKRGQSGNPGGRPKSTKLTEALLAKLGERASAISDMTFAEFIAQALITQALKGDIRAIAEIFDRSEGKPRQAVTLELTSRAAEQMGAELMEAIRETELPQNQADRLLAAVERRWSAIEVDSQRGAPQSAY